VRMFGCERSINAHIEKKKSKCDYLLQSPPTDDQVSQIIFQVNEIINQNLPVSIQLMSRDEARSLVDLSKLPTDASDLLRIVKIGEYDVCACIGQHVSSTSEIGKFEIISHGFSDGKWRVRFRLV
jgi:misacylated tRNA(Ala) deacylase